LTRAWQICNDYFGRQKKSQSRIGVGGRKKFKGEILAIVISGFRKDGPLLGGQFLEGELTRN
jgi:hypothetical protein